MRKISVIIFALFLCSCATYQPRNLEQTEAAGMYWASDQAGGTTGDLDKISGALLSDGDAAFVMNLNGLWPYVLDADNASAESSPGIISPDTSAGDKRWVCLYSDIVLNILGADTAAAIRGYLDLEAGTDFYSITAADLLFNAKLSITAIDDIPADDADTCVSSKWSYDWLAVLDSDMDGDLTNNAWWTAATTNVFEPIISDPTTYVDSAGARMNSDYGKESITVSADPTTIEKSSAGLVEYEAQVSGDDDADSTTNPVFNISEVDAVDKDIIKISNTDSTNSYDIPGVAGNMQNPDPTSSFPYGQTVTVRPYEIVVIQYQIDRWVYISGGKYNIVAGSIEAGSMAHFANADMTYDDNAGGTPYALTHAEVCGRILTNYGETGDAVYTFPAATGGENGIFQIGAAYQVDLEPPSGAAFWLNGTEMSADEHIVNAGDTEGEVIAWWVVEAADGTYEYHFESKYSNYAEATP